MAKRTTWKPHTAHGELSSEERKELPLIDTSHVRIALARFDPVLQDAPEDDHGLAFAYIHKAPPFLCGCERK